MHDLGWPEERLFSAWKLQRDVAIKQTQSLNSDIDLEALITALKLSPNLTSIRLSADGIGGQGKLRVNGMQDYFTRGETIRSDGRQLSIIMLAAAAAATVTVADSSPSTPFNTGTVTSFIVDEYFFLDEDEETYTERSVRRRPDFGSVVQLATIRSALPFFTNLTTLTLPLRQGSSYEGRDIEANLACLLAALPKLEHLTLYNSGMGLLALSQPLSSMTTRSLRTLELQTCTLRLGDMQNLFEANSKTLNSVQIENISLLDGQFIDFFILLRNLPALDQFGLNGWIAEAEDDQQLYTYLDERDPDRFYQNRERRYLAREAIIDFVLHAREGFPLELLDTSSPLCRSLGLHGMKILIGAAKFSETDETDYEYEI